MARRSTFIDRARRAFRVLKGEPPPKRRARRAMFEGAQGGRLFADWIASVMSPDDETLGSIRKLRARSRDLDRNNGLAHHFFDLLEINVIGPKGFDLRPQVRDASGKLVKATNTKIRDGFYQWADGPVSFDETLDFVGLQKLLIRTAAMDGEAFVRIHRDPGAADGFGLYLEPVDADLVDETLSRRAGGGQNEIRMGVEVDARGRRVAYHLHDPGGYAGQIRRPEVVPARDMIHILSPRRVNQTRGLTWLAPSMYALRQLGAYTNAELVAARMGASKMGFYYRDNGDEFGGVDPEPADASTEAEDGTPEGTYREEVEPGIFSKLQDGWKFQEFDPQHPTTAYGQFTKDATRSIACGLSHVSYESLSNDRESTTYSGGRTGLMLEQDATESLQAWLTFQFLRRIHWEWLSWSLLAGGLQLDTRSPYPYRACRWVPHGSDWVDPLKEVQAGVIAVNNRLSSRTAILAKRGLDMEEVLEEIAEEERLAASLNVELPPIATTAAAPVADEGGDGQESTPGDGKPKGKARDQVLHALNGNGSGR